MKTFIGILLVGLLGFFGCSGSNDGTTATVGQAAPVAPFGIIETATPVYEWTPVSGATKYRLLVQETNQAATMQDTNETYIIDEWYTAEESGCASEDGLCMVTPDTEVIGENAWKVQACANKECGLWSGPMNFDFTAMNDPRFTDNDDGTVTDNNTKLMWSKNASLGGDKNWYDAGSYCASVTLAGHSDWRLPPISELRSLIDGDQFDPALPPGNPFTNVQFVNWSSTAYADGTYYAWFARFYDGVVGLDIKSSDRLSVWCVRDGN